jgi:hypothetical protein
VLGAGDGGALRGPELNHVVGRDDHGRGKEPVVPGPLVAGTLPNANAPRSVSSMLAKEAQLVTRCRIQQLRTNSGGGKRANSLSLPRQEVSKSGGNIGHSASPTCVATTLGGCCLRGPSRP